MNQRNVIRLLIATLCIGAACSLHAASLVVEDGEISGIRGLEIQGQVYDLSFADTSFNAGYPAEFSGYGTLAQETAEAVVAASDSGMLQVKTASRVRGCESSDACTILIPDHATGTAPTAAMSHASELIYSAGRFRFGDPKWPFEPSTDTKYMPDMSYAILKPAE